MLSALHAGSAVLVRKYIGYRLATVSGARLSRDISALKRNLTFVTADSNQHRYLNKQKVLTDFFTSASNKLQWNFSNTLRGLSPVWQTSPLNVQILKKLNFTFYASGSLTLF